MINSPCLQQVSANMWWHYCNCYVTITTWLQPLAAIMKYFNLMHVTTDATCEVPVLAKIIDKR